MRAVGSVVGWCGLLALVSLAQAQDLSLRVVGLDGDAHQITAQTWAGLPRSSVQAVDHDGKAVTFDGVAAREVLKLANAPLGKELRGKSLAVYVLAEAADGYRAVYALAEFDAEFSDRIILIADRRNGQPLADKEGPLRVVVPGEKRQARWLRELVSISVRRVP